MLWSVLPNRQAYQVDSEHSSDIVWPAAVRLAIFGAGCATALLVSIPTRAACSHSACCSLADGRRSAGIWTARECYFACGRDSIHLSEVGWPEAGYVSTLLVYPDNSMSLPACSCHRASIWRSSGRTSAPGRELALASSWPPALRCVPRCGLSSAAAACMARAGMRRRCWCWSPLRMCWTSGANCTWCMDRVRALHLADQGCCATLADPCTCRGRGGQPVWHYQLATTAMISCLATP